MDAAANMIGGLGLFTGGTLTDLHKTIRALYEEKQRLDAVIASLETYTGVRGRAGVKGKRGRKSMGTEERLEVSERMRNYWAARRTAGIE